MTLSSKSSSKSSPSASLATFPPPAIEPLSRLQVSQGLLITTERWKHAQHYHRQRQNLHYQSLHQPGIVRGLGVCVIPPPAWAKGEELNYLWVRIAPGIAIDIQGNPIILEQPRELGCNPLKLDLTQVEQRIIYLVAQHVDPEQDSDIAFLDSVTSRNFDDLPEDRLTEHCRFVQRRQSELQPEDVELCRVHLQPGHLQLRSAMSVHCPEDNALDFRYRLQAKPRPQCVVQVGNIYADEVSRAIAQTTFSTLLTSTAHLSTLVQGLPTLCELSCEELNASPPNRQDTDSTVCLLERCHLVNLQQADLFTFSVIGRSRLRHYLQQGGVLLIEADANTLPLQNIQEDLGSALANLEADLALNKWGDEDRQEWEGLRSRLEKSLDQVNVQIAHNINTVCEEVKTFAHQIDYPIADDGHVSEEHLLKRSPFPCSHGPLLNNQPLQLFCWEGIVLVLGKLSELWQIAPGIDSSQNMRAAQEWGLNLLHYAWKHHHLTQLQQGKANP